MKSKKITTTPNKDKKETKTTTKKTKVAASKETKAVAFPEVKVTTPKVKVQTNDSKTETQVPNSQTEQKIEIKKEKKSKARSKKYVSSKALIDKTKKYELDQAVELVQKLSYSKFDGTVEVHLVVKEAGISTNVSFPHSTGKSIKVAIFSEKVAENIGAGQINFDILLATPQDMAKLSKLAKILGPKGLMPNPKNGTLTTNPEIKKKELEAGKVTIKTEKKAPLIHVGVGKVSMKKEELVENINALLKGLTGQILKIALSATMSPSVKVIVENKIK